jgi:alpha-glucosidase
MVLVACLLLSTTIAAAETAAPEASYRAAADPKAVVVADHARFTVLTPQMIRMEWAADGRFEDRPSFVFVNRLLPVPDFKIVRDRNNVDIETGALHLHYAPTGDGKFSAGNLSITLSTFKQRGVEPTVTWHPGLDDSGNLQGTSHTLDGQRGDKLQEPIEPGLISRDGWTLVDDSTRPLFNADDFTFARGEKSVWPWVVERSRGARQDWYFFGYGHEYKRALADYVAVAGRIPLPPRFAFGAWWSRYWAYSDSELEDLVQGFRQNDTPLDVFVIDMDWHKTYSPQPHQLDQSGHGLGWGGYSWNRLLFPDPEALLAKLHRAGLKTTLNLHPASGVQPMEDPYPAMARAIGQDPAQKKYVPFDITNQKFAQNYMDVLHHPLERQGVDFWWLDWQQENSTKLASVNPTWWLNYVHFTDQQREGKRPLLFHRWGGLGNHRYQIGFSGDTVSIWPSLAFQPWFTATAANVGYAYWSHDIGGHAPGAVEPELYTRWVQFGAFSPILRTHTSKNPDAERRIWAYPEPYSQIMRASFQLRYALAPYIYSEARKTYDSGVAFVRPLYYDYPEADAAYSNRAEYTFSDAMIVAPIATPVDAVTQLAKQDVWIPPGEWIEWPTGKHFTGPVSLQRMFSISQTPIYVRAGAIVPMQPPMQYTGQKPVDPLILTIWPLRNAQESNYRLYEDSSQGEDYKRGVFALTPIKATQQDQSLSIQIDAAIGSYPDMPASRGYELRLPADWPPQAVKVDGRDVANENSSADAPGWHYDGNTLTTIIRLPARPVTQGVEITIERAADALTLRSGLDGFAGSMQRLRAAHDTLNQQWPLASSPDSLIDAMQTGDRIGYHPDAARDEIAKFAAKYQAALKAVLRIRENASGVNDAELIHKLPAELPAELRAQRVARYRIALLRAVAELEDSGVH